MNKINKFNNYTIIIFLIFLSSFPTFMELINHKNIDFEFDNEEVIFPYVDSACKWSLENLQEWFREFNKEYDANYTITFYNHPSSIKCQGRPVITNLYSKTPVKGAEEILPIGVGVNSNMENLQNTGRYILLFLSFLFFYNKFKLNRITTFKIPISYLIYLLIIFSIYGYFVFPTLLNGLSDVLFSILIGNIIIFYFVNSYSLEAVFKSIITLILFPLFYFDSNISFWWLFLLSAFHFLKTYPIKPKTKYFLYYIAFLIFEFIKVSNFTFQSKTSVNSWILFTNHRHKGGIVDVFNGSQSIAYLIDISILIFIFYTIFAVYNFKSKSLEKDFSFSLIIGFLVWFVSYFISQINPTVNYFIYKLFGLNEPIDTIQSIQPDGINWRGLTSSHELTGFWLLIVFCIILKKILVDKNLFYLPLLIPNLISINWNSQRTTLLLMISFTIFLLFYEFKLRFAVLSLFSIFVLLIFIAPYSEAFERLENRFTNFDLNYEIDSQLRWEIDQTFKRYDKYNLDITKPDYEFNTLTNYQDFFQKELNTSNEFVLNSFSFVTKVFGREFQWFRFFYFTDIDSNTLIYGNGAGQSHQHLVQLIEKPHSLYFTLLYQYGFASLLICLWLILKITLLLVKSRFNYVYLLGLFFFIVSIKAELIFTHNQFIFFLCFIYYCFFFEKDEINK